MMLLSGRNISRVAKRYDELTRDIAAEYKSERPSDRFWEDLQKLFHDNTSTDSIPDVAFEVYLLLLFEIA